MPEQFQGKAIAQFTKAGSKKNTITAITRCLSAIKKIAGD
jgi:hypothetical protein